MIKLPFHIYDLSRLFTWHQSTQTAREHVAQVVHELAVWHDDTLRGDLIKMQVNLRRSVGVRAAVGSTITGLKVRASADA